MRLGVAVRCAIALTWLGLFGWHVVRHAAPLLGLSERADVGAVVAAHLDETMTYALRWTGTRPRDLGTCVLSFSRDDTRFRVDHRLRIVNLSPLLGTAVAGNGGLDLELDLIYDDRFRLAGVEGHVALTAPIEVDASYTGVVDHRGLVLDYALADGGSHQLVVPGVGRDAVQVVPLLPPRLKRGDHFSVPMLDPRRLMASGGTDARSNGAIRVEDDEVVNTAAGPLALTRVAFEVEGKRESTAWCDARGTIYRIEMDGQPKLIVELASIDRNGATRVWPPPEHSP
jgi:hypothetical protein